MITIHSLKGGKKYKQQWVRVRNIGGQKVETTVRGEEETTISNILTEHSTCSLSFTTPTCTFQQGGDNRGHTIFFFFWRGGGEGG